MARDLPNVYTQLNDLSALIEGDNSLTIGVTLRANRGPIGEAVHVTDSSDFLNKFTFTGKPGAKQDSTYWDILELLKVSSNVWVSRAANGAQYGAIIVKKAGEDGKAQIAALPTGNVVEVLKVFEPADHKIIVAGDLTDKFRVGGQYLFPALDGSGEKYTFTAGEVSYDEEADETTVIYPETIPVPASIKFTDAEIPISVKPLDNPKAYQFAEGELFMVAGADPGEYNNKIGIEIQTSEDKEIVEENCFQLNVINLETGLTLEEYVVSMDLAKKSIDGTNLFIKNVINGYSQYIQIVTPEDEYIDETAQPGSTGIIPVALQGGSDGEAVTVADNIEALQVFASKMVPVSLLINGNNEGADYQSAMLAICEDRKDCFAFIRTPRSYEKLTLPAQRVSSLVKYKKDTLASTSYMGAMFGPHAEVHDNYNARKVTIGMDSLACKQYLKVINEKGFPYAAAGPINGKLENLTLDWKIGDDSAEAKAINEASMNFLVFEPRQKYYYLNTQNTLQLANSAFRNIGAVLNVLNIKETLAIRLKDFVNLPITDKLQEEIVQNITGYMEGCKSAGRVSNFHLSNNTTKNDISNNELHFLLTLAPAYYAQKIYLVVNVVNAAFDFAILQAA